MAVTMATGTAQLTAGAAIYPIYVPADYVAISDKPGETILTNTLAGRDQPNTLRFGVQAVADIFKGTTCPVQPGQLKTGVSIVCQVAERWCFDDAADTMAAMWAPASCHFVMKVPDDPRVTPTLMRGFLERNLGMLMRNGSDSPTTGFTKLFHGITKW
jgi:hypothetical protein